MSAAVEDDDEYVIQIDVLLKTMEQQQNEVKLKYDNAVKRLNKNFADIDACLAKRTNLKNDLQNCDALLREAKNLNALKPGQVLAYEARLDSVQKYTNFLGRTKRKVGSNFLRYMLGHVSVRVWNESDKKQLRSEYNKFKQLGTSSMIIFPILQMIIGFSWIVHQWQQVFTIYYYFSLAIRENVLKLNGSRIKRWWIVHHYLSIATSFLSLLLLRSAYDDYEGYFTYTMFLSLWLAAVMWVQNQYQEARHYARVAMGKATIFDGSTSETLVEAPSQSSTWYYILIPLLYVTYVFEVILAGYCFIEFLTHYSKQAHFRIFELECLMLGILWLLIAFGNVTTTSRTIQSKHRTKEITRRLSKINNTSKKLI